MLFSIIIAAVLVGLVRGGRINNLLALRIKGPILVLSSFIVETAMIYIMRNESSFLQPTVKSMITSPIFVLIGVMLQYSLLFLFLFLNRKLRYSWLMALGSFLNSLVIILNRGAMPLSKKVLEVASGSQSLTYLLEGRYLTYSLVNDGTKLWLLGDIIYLPPPIKGFMSIGDILLFAGVFMLVQSVIVNRMPEYNQPISKKERSL